ncbi:hypothetical protein SCARR_05001 [Pontiella sulfatireligans]|uniref:Uncharacterized protein n=1 Tax=Pontiella sulfatireligans TaxID=2750658 RepID=A0A6C2UUQ6_9BACT|nr:hypothetical protein SCARR_05001 [Pontiella sulfatireligans]
MTPTFIAERFDVAGQPASIRPTGSGNVNDTYIAVFRTHFTEERIIIQRVNAHVFTNPGRIIAKMRRANSGGG